MRASADRAVSSIILACNKVLGRANERLSGHRPVTLLASGFLLAIAAAKLLSGAKTAVAEAGERIEDAKERGVKTAAKQFVADKAYSIARAIPSTRVQQTLDAELDKERKKMFLKLRAEQKAFEDSLSFPLRDALPDEPVDRKELMQVPASAGEHFLTARTSGARYTVLSDESKEDLATYHKAFAYTNPLHPGSWPIVQALHNRVTKMTARLLHDENAYGAMTAGGSLSIFDACFAYVQHAKKELGISRPRIIAPETAHAAFRKSAEALGFELKLIRVDPESKQVDLTAMRRAINSDTVALVGSAPNYAYGIADDIATIAKMAEDNNIACHVDSCLGGFITAFAEEAGYPYMPVCDFRHSGVTSISIDDHKYGGVEKGASKIMMRRHHPATMYMTHGHFDWSGGLYVTPGMPGSRPGLPIASAYYMACRTAKSGYVEQAKQVMQCTRALAAACVGIDGVRVCGAPHTCVVAIEAADLPRDDSIYAVMEHMNKNGWELNALKGGFHLCITIEHARDSELVTRFHQDLANAVKHVKANPDSKPLGTAKAYGQLDTGTVPVDALQRIAHGYQEVMNSGPSTVIPWLGEKEPASPMTMPRPW
ncbi:MAG: pyridoxal-dependent decarboxylase [Coxiellaceae bacterium]|nr:pyridoxal-dependent decarboxylase [Coxiellaceae bacterium]